MLCLLFFFDCAFIKGRYHIILIFELPPFLPPPKHPASRSKRYNEGAELAHHTETALKYGVRGMTSVRSVLVVHLCPLQGKGG